MGFSKQPRPLLRLRNPHQHKRRHRKTRSRFRQLRREPRAQATSSQVVLLSAEGESVAEIAEQLGISQQAAQSYLG
jgi:DNA-binding CsgD family transcriptional regulator